MSTFFLTAVSQRRVIERQSVFGLFSHTPEHDGHIQNEWQHPQGPHGGDYLLILVVLATARLVSVNGRINKLADSSSS